MLAYLDQIDELYSKMFGIVSDVLPANRMAVNEYLGKTWRWCYRTTKGFEHR
jgi:hypothetical protein